MENLTLEEILYTVEDLQNEMAMLESMTYIAFSASTSCPTSISDFTGALQLISIKSQEIYNNLTDLKQKLQAK